MRNKVGKKNENGEQKRENEQKKKHKKRNTKNENTRSINGDASTNATPRRSARARGRTRRWYENFFAEGGPDREGLTLFLTRFLLYSPDAIGALSLSFALSLSISRNLSRFFSLNS